MTSLEHIVQCTAPVVVTAAFLRCPTETTAREAHTSTSLCRSLSGSYSKRQREAVLTNLLPVSRRDVEHSSPTQQSNFRVITQKLSRTKPHTDINLRQDRLLGQVKGRKITCKKPAASGARRPRHRKRRLFMKHARARDYRQWSVKEVLDDQLFPEYGRLRHNMGCPGKLNKILNFRCRDRNT